MRRMPRMRVPRMPGMPRLPRMWRMRLRWMRVVGRLLFSIEWWLRLDMGMLSGTPFARL